MISTDDDVLTPKDLADLLKVDERKALDWRREYGWPCLRFGRSIRFTRAQVELILERHAQTTSPTTVETDGPVKIAGQSKRSARRAS